LYVAYYRRGEDGMKTLTCRVEEELDGRLEQLAAITHRTKSYYVREALLRSLEDMEDIYLAEQELEGIRAGRIQTTPLAEVAKAYGLEH
jgi:RHH-type transcriptional regulator, rel operon repressor / antitoxin RelB